MRSTTDGHRRELPKSPVARAALAAAAAAELTAKVWMLVEVLRRPREELLGPRWAWVLGAFVNTIGPVTWFVWGRNQRPDRG